MSFHAKNGWMFRRLEDGAVEITKREGGAQGPVAAGITLNPETWMSVMAEVSWRGQGPGVAEEAKLFHMAPAPDVVTTVLQEGILATSRSRGEVGTVGQQEELAVLAHVVYSTLSDGTKVKWDRETNSWVPVQASEAGGAPLEEPPA